MQSNTELLSKQQLDEASKLIQKVLEELDKILLGRSETHKLVVAGILSKGHILLEGLPGVGKTALIKTLSQIFDLSFSRIQFTPDLMPGDILGSHILQQDENGHRTMEFHKGPVFTNILLADEINRASPKTQSALLEAMQERSVTLMGDTMPLPSPFFVLASQNPIELEGTYALPEAQLDRFMFKLEVKGADAQTMKSIITSRRHGQPPKPEFVLSTEQLNKLFDTVDGIYLSDAVADYIARLVAATMPSNSSIPEVNSFVQYGASPRAAIAVSEAARAMALIGGRPSVGFSDVREVFVAALNHRVLLNYKAGFEGMTASGLLEKIMSEVSAADFGNAAEVKIA